MATQRTKLKVTLVGQANQTGLEVRNTSSGQAIKEFTASGDYACQPQSSSCNARLNMGLFM